MNLSDIIKNYAVEDLQYECKARLDRNNLLSWLKTVDGFANAKGGTLFVGVEDGTNKLIGFDENGIDKEKLFFYHAIEEHFETLTNISSEAIPYENNGKTLFVLKVNVHESQLKPVILMFNGLPCVFKRRDGYTSAATAEELIEMTLKNKTAKYDTTITDIKFDFEDFKKLREFYTRYANGELTEKKLAAIRFFDEKRCLSKGALLFKDDYDGRDSSVVCSIYEGTTRGDNVILASNKFQGNLIDALDYMMNFVLLHMNKGFIKKDTHRVDFDAFPRRSVLESVLNALAHRDYLINGTDISVDLFKNRLVITSPGSIFREDEPKTTYKLDKMISNRRNELICDVFVLCKVMEAKGTGFEKILDDYKEADEAHKPFIRSKYDQFSITLPDLTYKDGVSLEEEAIFCKKILQNAGKYDIKILAYCFGDYKNAKEIAAHLGISNSSFMRKNVLDNLVNQKYLILQETPKERLYTTNHELVERV